MTTTSPANHTSIPSAGLVDQSIPSPADLPDVRVWDPLVRVFHWTLVLAFFTARLTEDDFITIHTIAGYTVLGLLVVRIVWGLTGSRHARFSDFIYSPRNIRTFLKDTLSMKAKRYLGHNPAGGAMVLLLIFSLIVTTLSGLMLFGVAEGQGPLAAWVINGESFWGEMLEEVHEFFANFTLFLVFVHVAGVIIESLLHRENLVKAMFNGKKRALKE
jgi:cytochrome b